MKETKELYYYTSSDTMRFILTDRNIYATNLKYMNDGEEYVNGLTELRTVLNNRYCGMAEIMQESYEQEIIKQPKSYSISFSHERDLLSQWSMYAKESGICIRMDFSKDDSEVKYFLKRVDGGEKSIKDMFPRKVYYLTKHVMASNNYKAECGKIIKDIENGKTEILPSILGDIQDGIDTVWRTLAPYVKRREFFQEAEYRLVFNLNAIEPGNADGINGDTIKIDYRVDKNVLKPYLDVKREGGWPVREIMVGPGFNQKAVYDSVKHFLDNAPIVISDYKKQDVKNLGMEFLKRLDKDKNRSGKEEKGLSDDWKRSWKAEWDKGDVIRSFNDLIFTQKLQNTQNRGEDFWNHIYMTNKGIILSISETPYIY